MLIVLGGLPATGKTTIARLLSSRLRATHLRIDTIEQALRSSGMLEVGTAGYMVAYALAEDMLRLGQVVIADSVNPVAATRAAWRAAAARAGAQIMEVEIVRSDQAATRASEYEPWDSPHVEVDTAGRTVEQSVTEIVAALQRY